MTIWSVPVASRWWMKPVNVTQGNNNRSRSKAFWSIQTKQSELLALSGAPIRQENICPHVWKPLTSAFFYCWSCLCAQSSQLLYSHGFYWMFFWVFLISKSDWGFWTRFFQKDAGRVTTALVSGSVLTLYFSCVVSVWRHSTSKRQIDPTKAHKKCRYILAATIKGTFLILCFSSPVTAQGNLQWRVESQALIAF